MVKFLQILYGLCITFQREERELTGKFAVSPYFLRVFSLSLFEFSNVTKTSWYCCQNVIRNRALESVQTCVIIQKVIDIEARTKEQNLCIKKPQSRMELKHGLVVLKNTTALCMWVSVRVDCSSQLFVAWYRINTYHTMSSIWEIQCRAVTTVVTWEDEKRCTNRNCKKPVEAQNVKFRNLALRRKLGKHLLKKTERQ